MPLRRESYHRAVVGGKARLTRRPPLLLSVVLQATSHRPAVRVPHLDTVNPLGEWLPEDEAEDSPLAQRHHRRRLSGGIVDADLQGCAPVPSGPEYGRAVFEKDGFVNDLGVTGRPLRRAGCSLSPRRGGDADTVDGSPARSDTSDIPPHPRSRTYCARPASPALHPPSSASPLAPSDPSPDDDTPLRSHRSLSDSPSPGTRRNASAPGSCSGTRTPASMSSSSLPSDPTACPGAADPAPPPSLPHAAPARSAPAQRLPPPHALPRKTPAPLA